MPLFGKQPAERRSRAAVGMPWDACARGKNDCNNEKERLQSKSQGKVRLEGITAGAFDARDASGDEGYCGGQHAYFEEGARNECQSAVKS
jgi:hypothetical protein